METKMPSENRKLATIMSIDVVGYSKQTEYDDEAAAGSVRRLREHLELVLKAHEGRIFNTAGDGFMIEFPTATAAVAAALAILRTPDVPDIRVGIHVGEVLPQPDGDLLGHGVNVAARLQAMAPPGGAIVSDVVQRQIRPGRGARFLSRGFVTLPKMEERAEVFSIVVDDKELDHFARRQNMKRYGLMTLAVVLPLVTTVAVWDGFFREQDSLYRGVVRQWGVWIGVDPVDSKTATLLPQFYRFTNRGRFSDRPIKVDVLNGSWHCPSESLLGSVLETEFSFSCTAVRACGVRFAYRADGGVAEETTVDQYGNPLETLQYVGDTSEFTIAEAARGCSRIESPITSALFERYTDGEKAGYDREVTFFSKGTAALSPEGFHKVTYDYAADGRIQSKSFLDTEGRFTPRKDGIAGIQYNYSEDTGWLTSLSYIGADGAAAMNKDGVYGRRDQRDSLGRIVEQMWVGPNGESTPHSSGLTSVRFSYDEKGNEIEQSYFDRDGEATFHSDGLAARRADHDDRGRTVSFSYFGRDGEPVYTISGVAGRRYLYTDQIDGHSSKTTVTVDHQGTPISRKGDDCAYVTARYDEAGNIVEQLCENEKRAPGLFPGNHHIRKTEWQIVAGIPTRQIAQTYFDLDGKRTTGDDGISLVRESYDDTGRLSASRFFDENDAPTENHEGIHKTVWTHDERGRRTGEYFLDIDSQPLNLLAVVDGIEFIYDDYGRRTERTYVDGKRQLKLNDEGIAGFRDTYDVYGRVIERRFIGVDGGVGATRDGMSGWRAQYDARGNRLQILWLDEKGTPFPGDNETGSFGYAATYDDANNRISVTYLDRDLFTPMMTTRGYARFLSTYDTRQREIRRSFFDQEGEAILVIDGEDDTTVEGACGYHGYSREYDGQHRQLSIAYSGLNGAPAISCEGFWKQENEYDTYGWTVASTYYGVDGTLTDGRFGIARMEFEHNIFGKQTERRFYGADGELTLASGSGRATVRSVYDITGRQVKETSHGTNGELVDRPDEGWAIKEITYREDGSQNVVYTDKDGLQVIVEE